MIYTVIGTRIGGGSVAMESRSRNARRHLIENDLEFVNIYDKSGNLVSHAQIYASIIIFGAVRKN